MALDESLYERLGGDEGVSRLVDRFYDLMEALPEAQTIRAMHPDDLATSRTHLTLFLRMWTGGPRDYLEQRGHPRLRARHMPFAIGADAADAWMLCMRRAVEEQIPDPGLRAFVLTSFERVAQHMRNQGE